MMSMESTNQNKELQLFELLQATTKQVTVAISDEDLATLKVANYKLCFAKKVNEQYTVVWQAYDRYLSNNIFSWTPQYEIFGTNTFVSGVTVQTNTKVEDIALGQTAILDENGLLHQPTTGGPSTAITFQNNYPVPIHPGISQASKDAFGNTIFTPIYVAQNSVIQGLTTLTPKEYVSVWFQQDIVTSTMISSASSNSYEVDLTNTNSASLLFSNGTWSVQ